MSDLKLTKNNDLEILNGSLVLLTNKDEWIAQRVRIRLHTYKGEWYLDKTIGVPYFQTILKKNTPKDLVDSIFKRVISDTAGVKNILKFSSTISSNTYTLTFSYTTEQGTITSIIETLQL